MFGGYAAHVASLVEVRRRRGHVTLVFAPITLDEDAGDDKKEDGAKGAGESDKDD